MRSMTGFGAARASDGERIYTVEVRSVNHRYCDVHVHAPHELFGVEGRVEAAVRRKIDRGRVDVTVDVAFIGSFTIIPRVDLARARGYRDAYLRVAQELGLEDQVTLALIVAVPGVIKAPGMEDDLTRTAAGLEPVVEGALENLIAMREAEGRALQRELERRLEQVELLLGEVKQLIPRANEERRARLKQRLDELLHDRPIDPGRLAQEAAVLVDRADVTEELARLESHAVQLRGHLGSREAVGRKLDFLLQEMHREVNTLGSKTASAHISQVVVGLKSELERTREQVQNVE